MNNRIYVINGSVLGSTLLLVFCGLLFAGLTCVVLHVKKKEVIRQNRLDTPVYEYISPVYEYVNPTVVQALTENEAYNTCHKEISAYDIVY